MRVSVQSHFIAMLFPRPLATRGVGVAGLHLRCMSRVAKPGPWLHSALANTHRASFILDRRVLAGHGDLVGRSDAVSWSGIWNLEYRPSKSKEKCAVSGMQQKAECGIAMRTCQMPNAKCWGLGPQGSGARTCAYAVGTPGVWSLEAGPAPVEVGVGGTLCSRVSCLESQNLKSRVSSRAVPSSSPSVPNLDASSASRVI
ncbi:hypothetical protein FIBSPDRAFT_1036438 [Athelia psychrophila]|uniref:Uncharacterized protein n=1 Tax=Athelia psychrophila TaxID=1759441 RepID=A0A166VIW3_9AGAM|nr:hypothetical protein FIBSPDRAFT_1036438 [Fibularhizoctonia sp. CBS 109695]